MLVLTLAGIVTCDHVVGVVTLAPSQRFVTINRRTVLRGADPVGRPIALCPNIGPTIKPCTSTLPISSGLSSFVRIAGLPVCLDSVRGLTDGTPPGMVEYKVVQPGQTLVRTNK